MIAFLCGLLSAFLLYKIVLLFLCPQKTWYFHCLLFFACIITENTVIYVGDKVNILLSLAFFLGCILISCEETIPQKTALGFLIGSTIYSFSAINDNFLSVGFPAYHYGRAVFACLFYLSVKRLAPQRPYSLAPALWGLLLLLALTPMGIVLGVVVLDFHRYFSPVWFPYLDVFLLSLALFSFAGLLGTVIVLAQQERIRQENHLALLNQAYYENLREQNFQIRRLRHDMSNHLALLLSLQEEKREAYIRSLIDSAALSRSFTYCKDHTINILLSQKEEIFSGDEILFHVQAEIPEPLPFEPADLCALFCNALDNAREACLLLPPKERKITLFTKAAKGMLVLKVTNPSSLVFSSQGPLPGTSKKEKGNHGLGLKSIKETAEKYGGTMEAEGKEGLFTLFVYMPLS